MIISSSNIAVELNNTARTELVFQNMLVKNNENGIHSKNSGDCSIEIFNSFFEKNIDNAIYLKCFNVTAQIVSSTFKLSSVALADIPSKPEVCQRQKIQVLCHETVFDGKNVQMCESNMFSVKPYAAAVNITITDSQFGNHLGFPCTFLERDTSALFIYDHHSKPRNATYIFLKGLLFENNYSKLSAVKVILGYSKYTSVNVQIRDSIFRNNSKALALKTNYFERYFATPPTIFLTNNTFVENFYKSEAAYIGAAVYVTSGKM